MALSLPSCGIHPGVVPSPYFAYWTTSGQWYRFCDPTANSVAPKNIYKKRKKEVYVHVLRVLMAIDRIEEGAEREKVTIGKYRLIKGACVRLWCVYASPNLVQF